MSKYLIPIKYYFTVKEDANIYAKDVNITSTTDTSSSEYKTTHKGFFSKSTKKEEKQSLENIASLLHAKNLNVETGNLTLIVSQLKANSMEITTEILNMISSKESLYENEFSIKGGVLTATITTDGKIEEVVIPSTIEVNDKLIFNKKDITDKLETNELIKTLSSQGDLTQEQINLVKQIANSKEWHDKTTTLSGVGALIITAIVTYFTAGTGTGLVSGISNAALQTATQAAIQSVVVQATTSLVASAITGNQPKLDLDSLVTSAVTAGILSYANSTLGTNALTQNLEVSDYVKNASINGVGQGISSEIRGGEFKDGFATGAIISVVSDGALQMRKYVKDNYDYVGNGELSEGVNGDGSKVGGSHPEKVYKNEELYGKDVSGLTGGSQTKEGTLFGFKYENGGLIDKGIEYFGGPHDFMSSWNYENIDGVTYLKDNGALVNTASGLLLIPSVPFALAPFTQKYLDSIQNYREMVKDNKNTKEEAMNNLKDNR